MSGCADCAAAAAPSLAEQTRTFTFPLDGVQLDLTVRGTLTPANILLVKQYLGFVYDQLCAMVELLEEKTDG